jgi:hypothetical protein
MQQFHLYDKEKHLLHRPLVAQIEKDYTLYISAACTVGYSEFDFFLENEEYRPFDGCKIEI